LRCFNQKQRFGVDYLFPTRRYVNALTQEHLCLTSDTLATNECEPELWVRNPIFALQDGQRRPDAWVYLVGILGVPWQDLALDPSAEKLRYRSNDPTALDSERINWDWLLGDPEPADGVAHPSDPFMQEQLQPRSGTNPATGQAIVGPNGDFAESAINGHDWNIADESDLQYACTFELKEPVTCLTSDESEQLADEGNPVPYCDCTDYPTADFANPLCQTPEGEYGLTQYFGKAYPALRELEVLRGLGANAIVASICPKEMDNTKSDYGYRPAVDAMLARIRPALGVMNP
jgi:hypothetical protein